MRKFAFAVFIGVALLGCDRESVVKTEADQCIRARIFKECMDSIPKTPVVTHENNTAIANIVKQCDTTAYYQSLRKSSSILPACKP